MNTGEMGASVRKPGLQLGRKLRDGTPLSDDERRFWERPEVQKLAAKVREIRRYKQDSDTARRPPALDGGERKIAETIVKSDQADIWKTAVVFLVYGRSIGALGCDIEVQDMAQEGLTAKLMAIGKFDLERGISFQTFSRKCAEHRMRNLIRECARLKRNCRRARDDDGMPPRYLRASDENALASITNRSEINLAFERAGVTDKNILLMEARAVGMNHKAIARENNVTPQAVFNREARVRAMLRRFAGDEAASEVA